MYKCVAIYPHEINKEYLLKVNNTIDMAFKYGFNEVFTHTRTIFAKERPKKNLLDEFKEYPESVKLNASQSTKSLYF